jgi:hypothetical protein
MELLICGRGANPSKPRRGRWSRSSTLKQRLKTSARTGHGLPTVCMHGVTNKTGLAPSDDRRRERKTKLLSQSHHPSRTQSFWSVPEHSCAGYGSPDRFLLSDGIHPSVCSCIVARHMVRSVGRFPETCDGYFSLLRPCSLRLAKQLFQASAPRHGLSPYCILRPQAALGSDLLPLSLNSLRLKTLIEEPWWRDPPNSSILPLFRRPFAKNSPQSGSSCSPSWLQLWPRHHIFPLQ